MKKYLHINNFLKELNGYKEFCKHSHKDGFLQTMEIKKNNFVSMNIWVKMLELHTIKNSKKVIPTK